MPFSPTPEEKQLLLGQLAALNVGQIREFMVRSEIEGSDAVKDELLSRVDQALRATGSPTWEDLVLYLDEVEPFGRQHVYVYRPKTVLRQWRDLEFLEAQLTDVGI